MSDSLEVLSGCIVGMDFDFVCRINGRVICEPESTVFVTTVVDD